MEFKGDHEHPVVIWRENLIFLSDKPLMKLWFPLLNQPSAQELLYMAQAVEQVLYATSKEKVWWRGGIMMGLE